MNYQILIATQILQNVWWLVGSLAVSEPTDQVLTFLAGGCILIIAADILMRKLTDKCAIGTVLYLIYMILYSEASLRTPFENTFNNHLNTVLIIISYERGNENCPSHLSGVGKFAYPLYVLSRLISIGFVEGNLYMLENILISFSLIIMILWDTLKQKLEIKTQQLDLVMKSPPEVHVLKKTNTFTFHQEVKRAKSLGNKFKKSRTHYSQARDNKDICSPNPIYVEPNLPDIVESPRLQFKMRRSLNQKRMSIISVDKADHQMYGFIQSLLNIFPQGILIINQKQKAKFVNNHCEKLLQLNGAPRIIAQLKLGLLNAELPEEELIGGQIPRSKNGISQQQLEDIIRTHRRQQLDLDVFDVLLNPSKYVNQYHSNQSPYSEYDRRSSNSESQNETVLMSNVITYDYSINQEDTSRLDKKLKIMIIPTQMTEQQQEQFSLSSQQKVIVSKKPGMQVHEVFKPVLLIMIKNITKKHKIKQMEKEKRIHNFLLKSFSHELRTPLNCSQHMLSIVKDLIKDESILEKIQYAYVSILLLIHQINDILDYAAMQSGTFQYRWATIELDEIITELNSIYRQQLQSKLIEFTIKVDNKLNAHRIRTDKQRIIQVLVNLLNNSCKFTRQSGKVSVTFKLFNNQQIKIKVKDNGVGIQNNQLTNIKRMLMGKSGIGKSLHESRIKNGLGLGINISARIAEGLLLNKKNKLEITSNETMGTKISFLIEHIPQVREDSLRNPMISEYTVKNTIRQQVVSEYQNENNNSQLSLDLQSINRRLEGQPLTVSPTKMHAKRKSYIVPESPDFNDSIRKINNIQVPFSPDYFHKSSISSYNRSANNPQSSVIPQSICQQCHPVLIVDDVPFNQIALKAMLDHHKLTSDQAYDGYQAIEKVKTQLQKHCTTFKLIFMDIEMPGINGFQTTKEILKITNKDSVIVMCSAYDTQENFQEGKSVGITEFLPKPVNQRELLRVLEKYLLLK